MDTVAPSSQPQQQESKPYTLLTYHGAHKLRFNEWTGRVVYDGVTWECPHIHPTQMTAETCVGIRASRLMQAETWRRVEASS